MVLFSSPPFVYSSSLLSISSPGASKTPSPVAYDFLNIVRTVTDQQRDLGPRRPSLGGLDTDGGPPQHTSSERHTTNTALNAGVVTVLNGETTLAAGTGTVTAPARFAAGANAPDDHRGRDRFQWGAAL